MAPSDTDEIQMRSDEIRSDGIIILEAREAHGQLKAGVEGVGVGVGVGEGRVRVRLRVRVPGRPIGTSR